MRIRRAGEQDVAELSRIFFESGGDMVSRFAPQAAPFAGGKPARFLPVWRHLLETGAVFVADDPDPVGFSAAIVRDGVWFLSMLWVLPERQGSGIGGALLDEALEWGHGASTFSVVASPDPAAQTLYMRRSMFPVWTMHEFEGEGGDETVPQGVGALGEQDVAWLDALDRDIRGVARPEDHRFWRRSADGLALRREGRAVGYVYVWPGGKVGPGGVEDPADLPALLRAARGLGRPRLSLSLPSSNWVALNEVVRLRFRLVWSGTFMSSRPMPDGSRYVSSGGALG